MRPYAKCLYIAMVLGLIFAGTWVPAGAHSDERDPQAPRGPAAAEGPRGR